MKNIVAIKVDVDTLHGTFKGIPYLINLFKNYKIKGTFYVSLGSDNTGKKLFDVFKKGFFKKTARTNVLKSYGLKNLLYGVLIPAPVIYKKAFAQIVSIADNGYEVGIHSLDHVYWHQNLYKLSEQSIKECIDQCQEIFYEIYNRYSETFASPGWVVSAAYFKVIDKFNFKYLSDTRGKKPFYPLFEAYKSSTLQIPTTLFTLDELLGLKSEKEIIDYYVSEIIKNEFNVMTIHTEFEGGAYKNLFEKIILKLLDNNVVITDMRSFYNNIKNSAIEIRECKMDFIQGRALKVAVMTNS